jgi:hypothetical protein
MRIMVLKRIVVVISVVLCHYAAAVSPPPPTEKLAPGDLSADLNAPSRIGEIYSDAYIRESATTARSSDQRDVTVIVRFSDKAAPALLEPEDLIAVAKSEAKQKKYSVLTLLGDPVSIAPVIKTMRLQRWYRDWYRNALKQGAKDLAAKARSTELDPDGLPPDPPPSKEVAESWLDGDLHEFATIRYDSRSSADEAVKRLRESKLVRVAYVAPELELSQASVDPLYASYTSGMSGIKGQWGPKAMKMDFLWGLTPGHGYVGIVDAGTSENHTDELNSADGLSSFRKHHSWNFYAADAGANSVNGTPGINGVPGSWQAYLSVADEYYGNFGTTYPPPNTAIAGHGTHMHGIIAARSNNGVGIRGQCANCSVYVGKASGFQVVSGNPPPALSYSAAVEAIRKLAASGVQVLNLSWGFPSAPAYTCGRLNKDTNGAPTTTTDPITGVVYNGGSSELDVSNTVDASAICLAVKFAHQWDVAIIAAGGNNKEQDRIEGGVAVPGLQFPSSDARTISVGGVQLGSGNISTAVTVWDQVTPATAPGLVTNFPYTGVALADSPGRPYYDATAATSFRTKEVGSNSSASLWISAPARDIVSTMYEGLNHNRAIRCGSAATFAIPLPGYTDTGATPYTAPGLAIASNPLNRFGVCTGTSMAAPHITGLVGLIRSFKPLMPSISYQTTPVELDLKTFLKNNSRLPGSTVVARTNDMGYGLPDGELIRNALTFTAGAFVPNDKRSTPLLTMVDWEGKDYFFTTVPTMAAAAWQGTLLWPRTSAMRYCANSSTYAYYRNPQGYKLLPGQTGNDFAAICSTQSPATGPNGQILLPPPLGPCGCQNLAGKQNLQFSFYVFTTPVDQNNTTLYALYRYSSVDPATSAGRHIYFARPQGTPPLSGLNGSVWKFDGYEGYVFPPTVAKPTGAGSAVRLYVLVYPTSNTYRLATDRLVAIGTEKDDLISKGWQLETTLYPGGFMGWVIPSGGF